MTDADCDGSEVQLDLAKSLREEGRDVLDSSNSRLVIAATGRRIMVSHVSVSWS